MNKDSFVLLASLFVVMIENIDTLQAAGWRWDVGEGLSPVDKVFRDMANPGGFGQPASMTQYWLFPNTERADWVGVHINGVIHNRAAYLKLTTKDAAAWPTMSPREVAAIFYLAMTQQSSRTSQFSDSQRGVMLAARSLFRTLPAGDRDVKLRAISGAFRVVGIVAKEPGIAVQPGPFGTHRPRKSTARGSPPAGAPFTTTASRRAPIRTHCRTDRTAAGTRNRGSRRLAGGRDPDRTVIYPTLERS